MVKRPLARGVSDRVCHAGAGVRPAGRPAAPSLPCPARSHRDRTGATPLIAAFPRWLKGYREDAAGWRRSPAPPGRWGLFRLPELQRRELAVPLVQHPVAILIQGRQLTKTVARAGPKQLATVIYGAVAVAIQRHEAAPFTQAGQAVRLAILIDVEIDPGVGQAGYLAVQAEHQRIARALRVVRR